MKSQWELCNFGIMCNPEFLDIEGKPFNGTMEEWFSIHGELTGFRNKSNNTIVILNEHGYIAGRGLAVKK